VHLYKLFQVANAMAAKAKLVLRELKSVKADLAFAKQRCAQLEEENRLLRETKQKGSKTEEDDDLVIFSPLIKRICCQVQCLFRGLHAYTLAFNSSTTFQ
jgi:hypothetical protein